MLNFADDLSGGEFILSRSGGSGDADEPGHLCDFPDPIVFYVIH
jgi:hypothetical protein